VTSGTVFDVLVDLRKSSPTFGVWDGYILNTDTHDRLWVPPGCAHGFLVLSDIADFHYKVSTPYRPETECALRWNDPDLAIDWPIEIGLQPIVSAKDESAATFQECEKYD
jgi:dTDP-4-dehydrorhamnose 3,5-epimerase